MSYDKCGVEASCPEVHKDSRSRRCGNVPMGSYDQARAASTAPPPPRRLHSGGSHHYHTALPDAMPTLRSRVATTHSSSAT